MLPKDESTFNISVVGDNTKEQYRGDFTVKTMMTNGELLQVAVAIDRAGGSSASLPVGYKLFIRSLAELDVLVVDCPKWWKNSEYGRTLKDQNVVGEIHAKALSAQDEYKAKLAKAAEESEALAKKEKTDAQG